MGNSSTGRRPAFSAVFRTASMSMGLAAALLTSACTTTEGTNAFTDFETFEREVMTSTLQGFGVIDKGESKQDTGQRRAPLVLPKDASLPPPQESTRVAALPKDSDAVQIDTSGLTEDELRRLRNARVVDLRTTAGRPLTEAETRQLTARMTAARLKGGPRPLYMPPEEYFTNLNGTDLVCAAADGTLVAIRDPRCPDEIRQALSSMRPTVEQDSSTAGFLGSGPKVGD